MARELPIPPRWLDVLGDSHAMRLLGLVVEAHRARARLRYAEARSRLEMHPQQFQRSLRKLEDRGFVLLRAAEEEGRQPVYVEPTDIGTFLADFHARMQEEFAKHVEQDGLARIVRSLTRAEAEA